MNWRPEKALLILSLLLLASGLLALFSILTPQACPLCPEPLSCTCPVTYMPEFQILTAFLAGSLVAVGATLLLISRRNPRGSTQLIFDSFVQTPGIQGRNPV